MQWVTPVRSFIREECATRRSASANDIVQRLSHEVQRKLQLAAQSITKDDAETVCEEVFVDLMGKLAAIAQEVFKADRPCAFFEILADYYLHV